MLSAQAAAFNAVPICTAYDSLGPEGLRHSLNETEVRFMFTNAELLPTLAKVLPGAQTVKFVMYDGKADPAMIEKIQSIREGLQVVHMDDVRAAGKAHPAEATPAKREDVYCCMYTSGSSKSLRCSWLTCSWYSQGCAADSRKYRLRCRCHLAPAL